MESVYDEARIRFCEDRGETAFPVETEKIETLQAHYFQTARFHWNEPPRMLVSDLAYISGGTFNDYWDEGDNSTPDYLAEALAPKSFGYVDFRFVAGDPYRIALFETTSEDRTSDNLSAPTQKTIDLSLLMSQFQGQTIHKEKLLNYLSEFISHEAQKELLLSLRALATVANIYKMLPNSLLALSATSHSLYKMPWVPKPSTSVSLTKFRFSAFPMNIGRTFACIALFESGSCAVNPEGLGSVMAMAIGDSIYIAAGLLCDPIETPMPHEIRRIIGNIGKPGIAMLIPPKEIQNIHAESDWRIVNHAMFNGRIEDSFQSTSLHLRFTDYILPIDVGTHGLRDFEIYFLESVVSVHDRGKWVADLDILGGLSSPRLRRIPLVQCQHYPIQDSYDELIENPNLTVIDDWNEILDCPNKASIVRSAGNWLGRLATVSFSIQRGHPTMVLPSQFCWDCVRSAWQDIPIDIRVKSTATMSKASGAIQESMFDEDKLQVGLGDDGATALMATLIVASWDSVKEKWDFSFEPEINMSEPSGVPLEQSGIDATLRSMADLVIIC